MAAVPPQISLFYSIWAIITSRSHTRNNVRLHRGKRNSLREENSIADTGRHVPIWHAIDAFFNVRANHETPSGWVLAVLILLAVVMPPIMRYVAEHRNRKKITMPVTTDRCMQKLRCSRLFGMPCKERRYPL